MYRRASILGIACGLTLTATAQSMLTLDSCRALVLRNNKQLNIARLKQDVAQNVQQATRTKRLPRVSAMGGYQWTSKEISLLSSTTKSTLSNMGTLLGQQMGATMQGGMQQTITDMVQQGLLSPDQASQIASLMSQASSGGTSQQLQQMGNAVGQKIVDAFHTDTHNLFGGALMVTQPVYMGGAITAANRMADIAQDMTSHDLDLKTQSTLYDIDRAYWTVVSLRQKQKLAQSYRELVKKLDDDVYKMIREGVATRADGLRVDVKVNEADMQITQVDNGLSLAKMLLCQLCGLPLETTITLADENQADLSATLSAAELPAFVPDSTLDCRPEIRLLQSTIALSQQGEKLVKAQYLPHVAATGGYMISNPSVYNGFQKKFSGVWNVGIMVQVPIWSWNEGSYKVRAARQATHMAEMELADVQEKIDLQVAQSKYKLAEAQKRLRMAENNIKSANENLRCAQVGFREGVMESTDVMTAQTAWHQAQSQKIDAEVEVKLCQVNLQKALGKLSAYN